MKPSFTMSGTKFGSMPCVERFTAPTYIPDIVKEGFIMHPFCLGLSGQKRSGKDTVYEIIKDTLDSELNTSFKRIGFADNVKKVLCLFHYQDESGESCPVTPKFIEEQKINSHYIPDGWEMDVRSALINIGDRFRDICPTVWMDMVLKQQTDKIVPDVRYPNEAQNIYKDSKGLVIRIIRPDMYKTKTDAADIALCSIDQDIGALLFEGEINQPSIPYHYILQNNGTLEDLKLKIRCKVIPFILRRWKYFI